MSASRQTFEISLVEHTDDGEFVEIGDPQIFAYEFPFIDVSAETRNVTHEPLDEDPVLQSLGPGVRNISIEGHCYLDEANFIDMLTRRSLVYVLSDRWSGYGIVKRAETKATGEGGGPEGSTADRIYDYLIELGEVTDEVPDSVGPII